MTPPSLPASNRARGSRYPPGDPRPSAGHDCSRPSLCTSGLRRGRARATACTRLRDVRTDDHQDRVELATSGKLLMVWGTRAATNVATTALGSRSAIRSLSSTKASANAANASAAPPWLGWSTTSSAKPRPQSCARRVPRLDHPPNLEAICDQCHAVKTETETEQGKRKRVKRALGPDRWPA